MRGVRVSVALLMVFTGAVNAEPVRTNFAYGVEIETPGSQSVYELSIPQTVYEHVVYDDLRDVRVFNADGEVVPYVIRTPLKPATLKQTTLELPIFPLRGDVDEALEGMQITLSTAGSEVAVHAPSRQRASQPITAYLIDARATKQSLTALELQWPTDAAQFSMLVSIESSDDLRSWQDVVRAAPLVNLQFNARQLREQRIDFPPTQAKFFRLTWEGHATPFELLSLSARLQAKQAARELESTQVTAAQGNDADHSRDYLFDLHMQAPISELNLDLPQINTVVQAEILSRAALEQSWRAVTTITFYRLLSDGQEIRNRAIAVNVSTDRYWLVRIAAAGAIGSTMPSLTVSWEPQRLLFVARGGAPFLLAFGGSRVTRGETALDSVLTTTTDGNSVVTNQPELVRPALAQIGANVELGGAAMLSTVTPPDWKRWLLWSALLLGVGVLIWMARKLLQETSAS